MGSSHIFSVSVFGCLVINNPDHKISASEGLKDEFSKFWK